jgi:putative flippase GtrA
MAAADTRPVLDVVIPVYNEETDLGPCVRRLRAHLFATFPYPFQITIADNASTDATPEAAMALQRAFPEVAAVRLEEKGRGRALKTVWSTSAAPVLAYMDADLSTGLDALLPLVAPLLSGHSDVAIGTRLARSAQVVRGPKREIISRCYNLLLRGTLAAHFSDAQCGFKAIRSDVAAQLLPLVEDTGWFFDTELLVLAERAGLRIHEIPVDWVDDPDSRVDLLATAVADIKGIARLSRAFATGTVPIADVRAALGRRRRPLRRSGRADGASGWPARHGRLVGPHAAGIGPVAGVPAELPGQLVRFAGIGIASTLAYVVVYLLLRTIIAAQPANLVALGLTAVANTAANRRLTFGVAGREHAGRHHVQGLTVFMICLGLTGGGLALVHAVDDAPGAVVELTALVLANALATLVRFLLLRAWVFHPAAARLTHRHRHRHSPPPGSAGSRSR